MSGDILNKARKLNTEKILQENFKLLKEFFKVSNEDISREIGIDVKDLDKIDNQIPVYFMIYDKLSEYFGIYTSELFSESILKQRLNIKCKVSYLIKEVRDMKKLIKPEKFNLFDIYEESLNKDELKEVLYEEFTDYLRKNGIDYVSDFISMEEYDDEIYFYYDEGEWKYYKNAPAEFIIEITYILKYDKNSGNVKIYSE